MTNLLPTCAKMADCLHYLRSVRFFHTDNIDNPDLIKALEIGEKVHADLLALSGDDWISVDNELPKQNGFYLVCYDREFNDGFYLKKIDVVDFCKPINRFSFYHDFITHWQYLPQPPKE